jgi:nitrogen fixation protein NifU and related proteins
LSRKVKNKSVEKVKYFAAQAKDSFNSKISFGSEWKDFDKIMTKNNIARKECLLLPINTAVDALKN